MKSSPELHSSEYETSERPRRNCKAKLCGVPIWLISILLLIVVVVIVVPIAVMFGRKKNGAAPRSEVLVPLYVYPSEGAWDPLFEA